MLIFKFNFRKVEGSLKVKEIAGGGTTTTVLCDQTLTLWRKGGDPAPCPSNLPFSVALPTMFSNERGSWVRDPPPFLPLPTHEMTGYLHMCPRAYHTHTHIHTHTRSAVVSPADVRGTPERAPRLHYERRLQHNGGGEQE
jgi:hypothetical protein